MSPEPVNVKQVSIYLTHEQHERLLKLKEKTGAPVSEIIRRAIDQYLKAPDSKR
jgi:predicted DNA-binding protein